MEGQQIRVLDPTRPFKNYQYAIVTVGDDSAPKARLFLDNLARNDDKEPTFELNTVLWFAFVDRELSMTQNSRIRSTK